MKNAIRTAAVIAAAGSSARMGFSKLDAVIAGKSVLHRTLSVFSRCAHIDGIVIVTKPDNVAALSEKVKEWGIDKVFAIIAGADTRTQSVRNGIACLPAETEMICIHDAARPLVTDRMIADTLLAAEEYGAATAAVPCKNTIKVTDAEGFSVSTPDRSTLWEIQTPQCFKLSLYLECAKKTQDDFTDDCQIIEKAGERVKLVTGDYRNIKLTTPEDMEIAEIFLKARE